MKKITVALIGDPNSGKTTLFNALTGSNQRIGNWPGVTVEKKEGELFTQKHHISVIDLPGTYTLEANAFDGLDERITIDYVNKIDSEIIVNVVDASNLERHLYLTVQLLELKIPMVIVLTMMDRLPINTLHIDKMSALLGVPVIPVQAHKNHSLSQLINTLVQTKLIQSNINIEYPSAYEEDHDVVVADARYGFVQSVCKKVLSTQDNLKKSSHIDGLVLNRFLGVPIFLFVMYLMFLFSINLGGILQDFFDGASNTLFVEGAAALLRFLSVPDFFIAVFAYGVGKGINTLLTFIPVIASMFFFLSFIEGTGYMARAAFVIDRLMRSIGLPGKAFVPLIIGFGCNVPSVMATRTLESEKDRIMAAVMSPFMLCSARLAIFTVFVSVFSPLNAHNIIFSLYLIGIIIAIVTGFFLKSTWLGKDISPLIMELPPYQLPNIKNLIRQTLSRLNHFLIRAGKVIIPVCALLGVFNSLSYDSGSFVLTGQGTSLLSFIGKIITPLFYPMGLTMDNWPATMGLLMGTLAKEVLIGTLNTLYASASGVKHVTLESYSFVEGMKEAFLTIPDKINSLSTAFYNPILAATPEQSLNKEIEHVMAVKFGTFASAFSYLVFVLLYVPCISTMAAIKKELNSFWMYFSLFWSTGIAYMSATVCYQLLTFAQHPLQSLLYCFLFMSLFYIMKVSIKQKTAGLYKKYNVRTYL